MKTSRIMAVAVLYESWKYIAPVQRAAWSSEAFENGTWGGEIRSEFAPQPGEIVETLHMSADAVRCFESS